MNKFLEGWNTCYWTFNHWYSALFELEDWELSLWCFWGDFSEVDDNDRFKR